MLENFEQYCNVYNICENEDILKQYKDIAEIIVSQKNTKEKKNIITSHRHWYLFYYFDKFVKSEIILEEFFLLWDITSKYNILEYQKTNAPNIKAMEIIYTQLQEKNKELQNSLIMIDDWAYNWFAFNYQWEENVVIELANKQGSQLVVL